MSYDSLGSIKGGYETAHTTPADTAVILHRGQHVTVTPAVRDTYARVWLQAHDHHDIAEALGLAQPSPHARRSPMNGTKRAQPTRDCAACGKPFQPTAPSVRCCSRSCGAVKAGRTRAAQTGEA